MSIHKIRSFNFKLDWIELYTVDEFEKIELFKTFQEAGQVKDWYYQLERDQQTGKRFFLGYVKLNNAYTESWVKRTLFPEMTWVQFTRAMKVKKNILYFVFSK